MLDTWSVGDDTGVVPQGPAADRRRRQLDAMRRGDATQHGGGERGAVVQTMSGAGDSAGQVVAGDELIDVRVQPGQHGEGARGGARGVDGGGRLEASEERAQRNEPWLTP